MSFFYGVNICEFPLVLPELPLLFGNQLPDYNLYQYVLAMSRGFSGQLIGNFAD